MIGRRLISYLLNDPFGESCLLAGGYFANTSNAELVYPFTIIGIYHTVRMALNRKKLNRHIEKHGLSRKIMEKFSENSWCSNRVARAYAFGLKRYSEFRDIFTRYPAKYYIRKEAKNLLEKLDSIL